MPDVLQPPASPRVNPWLALWFRPGQAIEAALAQTSQWPVFVIVAVWGFLFWSSVMTDVVPWPDDEHRQFALIVAFASALVGLGNLYVEAFFFNLVARVFGGQGTQRDMRAVIGWCSVPGVIALALDTLAGLVGAKAHNPWVRISFSFLFLMVGLWSLMLVVAMVARVQKFGVGRAFASYLVGFLAVAFGLALIVRTFLYQPFNAPSASMIPAVQIGDYFFVSKFAYGYSRYSFPIEIPSWTGRIWGREPKRGDVIVLRQPNSNRDYIKRVIGLPGEKIQLKDGRLYIDGKLVDRTPVTPGLAAPPAFGAPKREVPTYVESLPGGAKDTVIEVQGDRGFYDNTEVFETPPGHYFVLGDNRDDSADSRVPPEQDGTGFVPFENIIGRVEMIYYSVEAGTAGAPASIRMKRIGGFVQ